jgi:hypothetical protein
VWCRFIQKLLWNSSLEHARSDDVRATAMALTEVASSGLDEWLGVALSSPSLNGNRSRQALL